LNQAFTKEKMKI